jgi:CheY-like chemotaxis protein
MGKGVLGYLGTAVGMDRLSILVVDDSLIMRKKISGMLEELGHQVVGVAKTGS